MHSTTMMETKDFSITVDGKEATFDDVFPDFTPKDRIGIVVNEKGGSVGASALLMAGVTRFYDFYRHRFAKDPEELWIYPDFFIFHVGEKLHMNHYYMEIWPPHKEVIVEDEPQQIMKAINERGITRLIVQDKEPTKGFIMKETRGSALERIVTALAYSPSGRTENSNIELTSAPAVEKNTEDAIDWAAKQNDISEEDKKELINRRRSLMVDGHVVETFRKIEVAEALTMLTKNVTLSKLTKDSLTLSSCNDDYKGD